MTPTQFRKLLRSKNLSATDAAEITFKNLRTIFRYLSGEIAIPPDVVALIGYAPAREKKTPSGRPQKKGSAE